MQLVFWLFQVRLLAAARGPPSLCRCQCATVHADSGSRKRNNIRRRFQN
ncbi:hypothetical protein BSLA_02f1976 [Burkholderia stabilis]|nr:hypothetical protein BSLA_02f1976 [Burkholderia stabilis]